jgi:hypothetical protein
MNVNNKYMYKAVNNIYQRFFSVKYRNLLISIVMSLSLFTDIQPLCLHGAEPFLRSRQLCSHSGTFQHFMEPEGSIHCSQEPSAGPYPEPYQSNSHHHILCL